MKRVFFLLLSALFVLPAVFTEDLRVVINSGHIGPVYSMAVDERNNLLFSGGEDGTIRTWDIDANKLISLLQPSHYPIMKIALHPRRPYVAAVRKNGINSYQLTVWNWERKTELYTKSLEEMPLHLRYSPKGTYIIYSRAAWDSLTFLQSITGRKLDLLSEDSGIVSYFDLSPTENTILTYSPSGCIDYYDTDNGKRKYSFKTIPNLEKICFTANLRFMAATDKKRFLLIDLTNGKVLAEADIENINTISANALTGEIMVLYPLENYHQVSVINAASGEIKERKIAEISDIIPGEGAYHINTLYIPQEAGDIAYFECVENADENRISRNTLAAVTSLAFAGNRMGFAAEGNVVFIDSDFFSGTQYSISPNYFDVAMYDVPYSAPMSLCATEDENFLLWQHQPGKLTFIDGNSGKLIGPEATFESDLVEVTPSDGTILTLENSGTCSLLSKETLEKTFSYSGFGIKTAALAGDSIFLGKSRASGFNAPILEVNHKTGETVPVFDSSIIIYKAKYNSLDRKIYALAVENSGGSIQTVLKSFRAPSFRGTMELLSHKGEDLTAHINFGPEKTEVYTTLGFEGVTGVSYGNTSEYGEKEHIPRKVYIHNDFIYTINTDFSMTVWSKDRERKVMDFYMFNDLEWVALLADGKYYASDGAEKYISVYDGIDRMPSYKRRDLKLN